MSYQVYYSLRAQKEYTDLMDYILNKFGYATMLKTDLYFEKVIDLIEKNPFLFPELINHPTTRRCVASEQTSIYYRVTNNDIELISFRGNQMNPNSILE